MQYQANADQYLATEVFTAPPQKLQLMLIDAALRLLARAERQWQANENGQAFESLLHAQEVIDQLMTGLNREANPELVDRMLSVYDFLARRLAEASAQRDEKKLKEVVRVLEIERGTWKIICEKLSGKVGDETANVANSSKTPAPVFDFLDDLPAAGFSLEA